MDAARWRGLERAADAGAQAQPVNYLVAVDYAFVDRPGGMGRVAWDIATVMRQRGHHVAMVSMHQKRPDRRPTVSEHDGIRVVRYDRPALPGWHPGRVWRTIEAAAAVVRAHLMDRRWDLIHIHSLFTGHGVLAALGRGPRYVCTVHSPTVLEQQINWAGQGLVGRLKLLLGKGEIRRLERRLLEACTAIHTLSEYTRKQLDRFHGVGPRVTVVPHWRRPGDTREVSVEEARRRLGWPQGEKLLLSVRRLGSRYGIDVAIRAVAPLAAAGRCRYYIGGDGPLRAAFEQLVRDLGVADRVHFLGRISDADLALAYQAADLFLLPTLALECFGLITLEAFSYGCPVLSSDAAAIPETMRPILPELVVPAGDVDALRRKIDDFLSDRIRVSPDELVQYAASRFDAGVVVPRLLALLEPSGS